MDRVDTIVRCRTLADTLTKMTASGLVRAQDVDDILKCEAAWKHIYREFKQFVAEVKSWASEARTCYNSNDVTLREYMHRGDLHLINSIGWLLYLEGLYRLKRKEDEEYYD